VTFVWQHGGGADRTYGRLDVRKLCAWGPITCVIFIVFHKFVQQVKHSRTMVFCL